MTAEEWDSRAGRLAIRKCETQHRDHYESQIVYGPETSGPCGQCRDEARAEVERECGPRPSEPQRPKVQIPIAVVADTLRWPK